MLNLQPLTPKAKDLLNIPMYKIYKLSQINFPVGIGARYDISALLNVRAEIVTRILQTDYLDDVSGRYIDPQYLQIIFRN